MSENSLSGADFKQQLRAGIPKMGLFLNAHSPTVADQLAHSGYDWLLVDTQHGPMGYENFPPCFPQLPAAEPNPSSAWADTTIAREFSRLLTWARMGFSFPTSTVRKKRGRRSVARSIRGPARVRSTFPSAA